MSTVVARAHTNIALVKYWGKRDVERNLPATGSLSLTLDRFHTTTALLDHYGDEDVLFLDGDVASAEETARVSAFLDIVAPNRPRFQLRSNNHVPTAAGLASSASAFAALALAINARMNLGLEDRELTQLARRGSGSAARSIYGGFVRLHKGERDDGADCFAEPCEVAPSLDVRLLVARCATGRKKIGSTDAMERTRTTSAYYDAWVQTHARDLDEATEALRAGDLPTLGAAMERSTLKMHACALAADPGIWYLAPTTVAVMNEVRRLRESGASCWFTMDAGPHVKVLTPADTAERVAGALRGIEGVLKVESCATGPAAHLDPEPA